MLSPKPPTLERSEYVAPYGVLPDQDRVKMTLPPCAFADAPIEPLQPSSQRRGGRPILLAGLVVVALGVMLFVLSGQRDLLLGQLAAIILTPLVLFGLVRGGIRKSIMLAGLFAAVYFAAWLPPIITPLFQPITGASAGLASYLVTGASAVVFLFALGLAGKSLRRRLDRRPIFFTLDRVVGAGIGAGEGLLVLLTICWVSTLLEPQALRLRDEGGQPIESFRHQFAGTVIRLAREASTGPIGDFIRSSNPINNIPALRESIEKLNRTGQLQFDGLDPKLLEQVRRLLQSETAIGDNTVNR